jgi:mono/diheme cytochrome c family protein
MRRAILIALPVVCLLAGCGGKTVTPTPETVVGKLTVTSSGPTTPTLPQGDAGAGKAVFTSTGCGGCHMLEAAGSQGTVGPNLDQLAPALEAIQAQVITGGGGMPPYKGVLTDQQIADVSQYVFESTHGSASGSG